MGDEALKLQEAVQRASELQITTTLVFLVMFVIVVVVMYMFIRNSANQSSILTQQLNLQGKQLDAFNQVAAQVGNLDRALQQQNIKNSEYSDNFQKHLTTMTGALDTTLKNSITVISVLARVEESGLQMKDELKGALTELGEARKEVKQAGIHAEQSNSGVHQLADFMKSGLIEVHRTLNAIAEKVEDLPQIREQLNAAKQQLEKLSRDVQRLDIPRTEVETKPPQTPNEGKDSQ